MKVTNLVFSCSYDDDYIITKCLCNGFFIKRSTLTRFLNSFDRTNNGKPYIVIKRIGNEYYICSCNDGIDLISYMSENLKENERYSYTYKFYVDRSEQKKNIELEDNVSVVDSTKTEPVKAVIDIPDGYSLMYSGINGNDIKVDMSKLYISKN